MFDELRHQKNKNTKGFCMYVCDQNFSLMELCELRRRFMFVCLFVCVYTHVPSLWNENCDSRILYKCQSVLYTHTHTHQRNIVNFYSEKFFSVPSRSFFYLFSYWICQPTGRSWATISVDFFSMEFFFFYYYYSTQSIWYISWLVWQFVYYSIWHLNFILF